MSEKRARSPQEIFNDMHRELRSMNHEVPESPERIDPVIRFLLNLYSCQLAKIDERVDKVWDVAAESIVRSMCPESMRWPIPAYTLMRCIPKDPTIVVDTHTRFFYKEEREGGKSFYFSSIRNEKILRAEVKYLFLRSGDDYMNIHRGQVAPPTSTQTFGNFNFAPDKASEVYIGIDFEGNPSDFKDSLIFINAETEATRQLQWGIWYPGNNDGGFYEDSGFCPGLGGTIERMFASDEDPFNWGGLRTSSDLFAPIVDSLVCPPDTFAATWEIGPPPEILANELKRLDFIDRPEDARMYWIRVNLPRGGDRMALVNPINMYLDSFIIVNKHELNLFKHTGGYRLIEVELPDDIANILEITRVTDSNGKEYRPRHLVSGRKYGAYGLEERGDRLVLWFDYSQQIGNPPDSLTVYYAVTGGTAANGISAGKITELYENHPGIKECVNLIPVRGAVPAKSREQILTEVASRLRNRDRALNFHEIASWTKTFDPRITAVACSNGIERSKEGVRRCIIVKADVQGKSFYSDDETVLLKQRLSSFLKSRSPLNTNYRIEVVHK